MLQPQHKYKEEIKNSADHLTMRLTLQLIHAFEEFSKKCLVILIVLLLPHHLF